MTNLKLTQPILDHSEVYLLSSIGKVSDRELEVLDTHVIQALDASSHPISSGVTWTTSNPNIVSLSSDNPPVLTALAVGHVMITAGTATADIRVSAALPVGTILWSNPGSASGVKSIVPAVPSASGVADVFAFQNDGTVQAITTDGTTAWTADVSVLNNSPALALPDFQGGLVLASCGTTGVSVQKLDGITGQPYPAYTSADRCGWGGAAVLSTDGTVFLAQAFPATVVGIDPTTGTAKFSVPLVQGNANAVLDPFTAANEPNTNIYGAIVAGDGYAYIAYGYLEGVGAASTYNPSLIQPCCWFTHLMLLRVNSSGEYNQIDVKDWTTEVPTALLGQMSVHMITIADQGVLLAWEGDLNEHDDGAPVWSSQVRSKFRRPRRSNRPTPRDFAQNPIFGMAVTTGTNVTLVTPPSIPGQGSSLIPVLQAQDGSFVGKIGIGGTDVIEQETNDVTQYNMVAFDSSGNVPWVVPNEQPQIATADGGVIGQSGVRYDSSGNATGQLANLPIYSWKGAYQVGSTEAEVPDFDLAEIATTDAAVPGGNLTGNGVSLVQHTFGLVFCGPEGDGTCNASKYPFNTTPVSFSYLPVSSLTDQPPVQSPLSARPILVGLMRTGCRRSRKMLMPLTGQPLPIFRLSYTRSGVLTRLLPHLNTQFIYPASGKRAAISGWWVSQQETRLGLATATTMASTLAYARRAMCGTWISWVTPSKLCNSLFREEPRP